MNHPPAPPGLIRGPDDNLLETEIPEDRRLSSLTAQPQQPPERSSEDDSSYEEDPGAHSGHIVAPGVSHDDAASGEIREYTGVFEGPEKTLEVVFRRSDGATLAAAAGHADPHSDGEGGDGYDRVGLRRLSRPDLDRVCERARVTILSRVSNRYLDAYVLSESSLFVYPYMLILKTCGTTTLLRCLAVLIELGRKVGLELDWMGYSRKNFNFPGDQAFPHQSFHQELEYLYSHRNLCERLDGNGYTLGPVTGDHWFVFVADQTIRSKMCDLDTDRVLNIMMFDIDQSVAEIFYYNAYAAKEHSGETEEEALKRISTAQTKAAGIDTLCPGAIIDPCAFEPCGYSMNAILFRSYSTMHITPEVGSSYASFETNQRVSSYESLINNVVRSFRPKRFVMTLIADEAGLVQMKENPLTGSASSTKIVVPCGAAAGCGKGGDGRKGSSSVNSSTNTGKRMLYKRTTLASIKVEDDCCCMMGNFVLEEDSNEDYVRNIRAFKERGMSMS
mmetsp:Transcript_41430/g.125431  ORF Transcript_41430/g.125431 Transcript_41430/m.125431 type:complete len:503 (-) Transcript_41430:214-1722(-)